MALTLSHYRFGVDELAENTHGWYAAEDTDPAVDAIPVDTPFLLRFCVQADATGLNNVDAEFQYRRNGGTWTNITTTSSVVKAVAATALTNGGNCTQRLSGTGTFESSGAGQTEDGISGGAANDIVANGNSETECGLQIVGADIAPGDIIEFRLTRDGGVLLDTYSVVPSITIAGAPVADDACAGWAMMQSAFATALAIGTLATSTAIATSAQQVTTQPQDEIAETVVSASNGGQTQPLVLGRTRSGARVTYGYSVDAPPPQPAAPILDDSTWEPPFVVPPVVARVVPQLQDDLPIAAVVVSEGGGGQTGFTAPPKQGPPRISYGYSSDVVPPSAPASAPAHEDYWFRVPPFVDTSNVAMAAPWAFGGDSAIPGIAHEDYWFERPFSVRKAPARQPAVAPDEVPSGAAPTVALDDSGWVPPRAIIAPPRILSLLADETIVPQAVASPVTEDYWLGGFGPQRAAPKTAVFSDPSDVVPPPGIAYEEYWWTPLRPVVWPISAPWPWIWEMPLGQLIPYTLGSGRALGITVLARVTAMTVTERLARMTVADRATSITPDD